MLCDLCHKNVATVHLTEIINDKVVELHICSECAHNKTEELKNHLSISEFLSGILNQRESVDTDRSLRCPSCGMSFYEFRKKGRLGCAVCYRSFRTHLIPLIKKIHGTTHHKGKLPRKMMRSAVIKRRIKVLQERLDRAVQLEEYEEAAALRDEIKKLEREMKNTNNV